MKFFNKDTGYGGRNYEKLTQKAICDELGNVDAMEQYVLTSGNIGASAVGQDL